MDAVLIIVPFHMLLGMGLCLICKCCSNTLVELCMINLLVIDNTKYVAKSNVSQC